MKRILFTFLLFILCFTACGNDTNSPEVSAEFQEGGSSDEVVELIWALPSGYAGIAMRAGYEDTVVYLNERLQEDGYNFRLSFTYTDTEYDTLAELAQSGGADILSLGFTNDSVENIPARLIQSDVLLPLDEYLQSEEGEALYRAFYGKVWETISPDGTIRAIPDQTISDGTLFAAFNKMYFSEDIVFNGTVESLCGLLAEVQIPEDVIPVVWDRSVGLFRMSLAWGYHYDTGVWVDINDGHVVCPYETEELVDNYRLLNELYLEETLIQPTERQIKEISTDKNFAVWIHDGWDYVLEAIKDDVLLVQLPYAFPTRTSGSTAVSRGSTHPTEALQLLTLVYSDPVYASLLINGKEGVTYQIEGNYARVLQDEGAASIRSLFTGVFDYTLPYEGSNFSVDRVSSKWSLYGTEAMRESVILGFMPDISKFDEEMAKIKEVAFLYEDIWMREDFDTALQEAVDACNASGSKRVEAALEEQIAEWRSKVGK